MMYTRPSRNATARDAARRDAMIRNLERLKVFYGMTGVTARTVEDVICYLREIGYDLYDPSWRVEETK